VSKGIVKDGDRSGMEGPSVGRKVRKSVWVWDEAHHHHQRGMTLLSTERGGERASLSISFRD
jgi:hypothetical protein